VRNYWRLSRLTSHFLPLTLLIFGVRSPLNAQDDLVAERSAFALWLASAPDSPLAALAQQAIGTGLTLGPEDADVPLKSSTRMTVREEGRNVILSQPGARTPLPRDHLTAIGSYQLRPTGTSGRSVLTVFGPEHRTLIPSYFPADTHFVMTGSLTKPASRVAHRILMLDGVETEAIEAGVFTIPLSRWSAIADRGWYAGDNHIHHIYSKIGFSSISSFLYPPLPISGGLTDALWALVRAAIDKIQDFTRIKYSY